ncbi:MAG: nitroreductase family protein [Nanoarchaeota archaeon]|jgi:nitroreductase/dihydropteridine reductase|nr:nitroreductase family protein [Nanoarchaeota archaeon]
MEVLDVIRKRYAAKNFSGEKIKDEDLDKMKEAIRLAPSSFNWQPWKIKIVSDKETLDKLQIASWNQPQIGTASHLFIFCAMDSLVENNDKLMGKMRNMLPAEQFEIYNGMTSQALSSMDAEAQKRMSERELFLPAAHLSLSATDLGYASCHIGGFVSEEYRKILDLPKNLTPIVIVPVGVPADEGGQKYRFPEDEVFF